MDHHLCSPPPTPTPKGFHRTIIAFFCVQTVEEKETEKMERMEREMIMEQERIIETRWRGERERRGR